MKTKTTKIVILFVIGFIFPLILNFNFNINQKVSAVDPKNSGGYTEPYIHIDGTNWTSTAASNPWCYVDNGVYIIENVTIDANSSPTGSGILIEDSISVDFIIRNCTVYNAGSSPSDAGIKLRNTQKGTVYNNTCLNNGYYGIMVYWYSTDNTISGNRVYNKGTGHQNYGIHLSQHCTNNIIMNNIFYNNTEFGLSLYRECDSNTITGNVVFDNGNWGISLWDTCDDNTISGNNAYGNNYGIYVNDNSHNNNITGNTFNYNKRNGLELRYSDNTIIKGNIANFNVKNGMYLYWSEWNNVTENTVNDNTIVGIYVNYFSLNNIIRNNTINRNDLGIMLHQSNNNNLSDNILIGNNYCIYELFSSGNIITGTIGCMAPLVQTPISIDATATGVGAHNWTWAENQPWCSGSGTWDEPYIIENLAISGFGVFSYGIEVQNSDAFFEIRNCKIFHAIEDGIYLDTVNNSRLINNNCTNNGYAGIALIYQCSNNTISGNTVNNNDNIGVYIYDETYNNTILGNTAMFNGEVGISLHWSSNDTIIKQNTMNNNGDYGLELYDYCGYNKILDNTITNNGERGINLEYQSSHNIISDNSIENNRLFGVYLDTECKNNLIKQNTIINNSEGISFNEDCDFNNISGNTISGNSKYGIHFMGGGEGDENAFNLITDNLIFDNNFGVGLNSDSDNNTLYENIFMENIIHAVDNGTDNMWNSTTIGNYWDNHTGPDANKDGIVDIPYTYIGGTAGSIDYLPIAEHIAPDRLDPGIIAIIVIVSVIGGIVLIGAILVMLEKKGIISLEKIKGLLLRRK